jgi:type II secretory pathway component GspD/PulD (secretin)
MRLYQLRHVSAARAARALEAVFPKSGFDPFDKQQTEAKATVVTDPRTNSVLITGTPAALAVATKLLEVLDETAASGDRVAEVAPGSPARGQTAPGDLDQEKTRPERGRRSVDRTALEERLERLELQASEILNQIHQIKQEMGASPTLRAR